MIRTPPQPIPLLLFLLTYTTTPPPVMHQRTNPNLLLSNHFP